MKKVPPKDPREEERTKGGATVKSVSRGAFLVEDVGPRQWLLRIRSPMDERAYGACRGAPSSSRQLAEERSPGGKRSRERITEDGGQGSHCAWESFPRNKVWANLRQEGSTGLFCFCCRSLVFD